MEWLCDLYRILIIWLLFWHIYIDDLIICYAINSQIIDLSSFAVKPIYFMLIRLKM